MDRQGGIVGLHHCVWHLERKSQGKEGTKGRSKNTIKAQRKQGEQQTSDNILMSEVYLGWGDHAESVHDAVRILLSDFPDKQRAHARAGASTQGVCELEALEAVTGLCLLPHHIQDSVHQLGSLSVVAFSPVITSSTLACGTCKYRPVSQLYRKTFLIYLQYDFYLEENSFYLQWAMHILKMTGSSSLAELWKAPQFQL